MSSEKQPKSPTVSENDLDEKRSLGYNSSNNADSTEVVNFKTGVDVAADLVAGDHADDRPLDLAVASRIRRKLDWHLLPLLFALYCIQSIDKGTLGASAILGIRKDLHLSADEFNNVGSAFYAGYLVFQYPQQLALQKFPVATWLSFNIFVWSLLTGLHAVCKNYGGIFTLRFFLGGTEGCVTAAVMVICSMFYTRTEIGERIGWTFQLNGLALIISSFLSFGVYHANPNGTPSQWQWLMIIVSILTFIVFALFLWRFPNNPTTAIFFTQEEKIMAIKRVQSNQNGIETKIWKRHQFIEALKDPKTWLFFLFAAVSNLQNGISIQYSIIIKSFGFNTMQTTLLAIPSGAAQIINVTIGCYLLRKFPNSRSWIAMGAFIPSTVGAILLVTLPFDNKNGLLVSYYILNLGGTAGFVMVLSWVTSTTAGHTKKLATNGIFLIGYALGQILCTQFWKERYRPRNYVPWAITLASYVGDWVIILALRFYLSRENKRRDALVAGGIDSTVEGGVNSADVHAQAEFGYLERTDADGNTTRQKVEKGLLDLTDRENLAFRYVL